METKYIAGLVGLIVLWLGVFAGDAYMASTLKEADALNLETEKMNVAGLFDMPKNLLADSRLVLDKKVNQKVVDIPVNKLKFYQDQYQGIPNVICDEYNELKLQRNYQMNISTYENTKILQWVKMFDLKFNENPDGNVTTENTNENISSDENTEKTITPVKKNTNKEVTKKTKGNKTKKNNKK